MATIGNLNPTLAEVAKRLDPNGKIDKIVELMSATNEVLMDMTSIEGNLPDGHKTTVRTGLPTATWRLLNYGVQPSKSRTVQRNDTCGMLEAYAEVDVKLANLNGNSAEFRLSEDRAFLEAMNQEMASMLFYGNTATNPEQILGLAPRYNTFSTDKTQIGYNVIDGGGESTDNTSAWLVVWSPNTIHTMYPKGSKGGFQHEDLGKQTLEDENGGKYEGYRTHYSWDIGLCVRDWRYAVRIANIDVGDLADAGETTYAGAQIVNLLIKAMHKIPAMGMGRPVIYANSDVVTALDLLVANKSNIWLTQGEYAGKKITEFRGIPIRRCDALLNDEELVA